ncbi:MAG: nucleoside triphosphate pyrophosphohydrolase [Clostridia bacterium]|nr:nucleoside triphosphate pyrophosphohydrolase [Clostridia bacterium]
MGKITVVGLGLSKGDITLSALNVIKSGVKLIARTSLAVSYNQVTDLVGEVPSLDFVYKKSRNFDTLNKNLAKAVIGEAKTGDVAYLVDGSAVEDNSVLEIIKKHDNVEIIAGVSAGAKCLENVKAVESGYTVISAYDVGYLKVATYPLIVYAIDTRQTASNVKLILSDLVGEETTVTISSTNGVKEIKLYELDRQEYYGYDFSLYIKKQPLTKKSRFDFLDLIEVLENLRGENGCPWDKAQTPKSVEKNLIEETYELIDAIEEGDDDKIIEETGDVLLQAAFEIIFGVERGAFTLSDVLTGICYKLISRHTHVFGEDTATDANSALDVWNKNKAVEKGYETGADYLKAVPRNFPSVMRAEKVGSRAGKYNLDFSTVEETFIKLDEEVNELKTAVKLGDKEEIKKECGDLLFTAVNVLRKLGVDGETSLNATTDKFIKRFEKTESLILNDGKNIKNLTANEVDCYYRKSKE